MLLTVVEEVLNITADISIIGCSVVNLYEGYKRRKQEQNEQFQANRLPGVFIDQNNEVSVDDGQFVEKNENDGVFVDDENDGIFVDNGDDGTFI